MNNPAPTVAPSRTQIYTMSTTALSSPKTYVFQCSNPNPFWIITIATRNPSVRTLGLYSFVSAIWHGLDARLNLLSGASEYYGHVCLYSDSTVSSALSPSEDKTRPQPLEQQTSSASHAKWMDRLFRKVSPHRSAHRPSTGFGQPKQRR